MEEYVFGPDFPYGEHCDDEELVVYKVYLRMDGSRTLDSCWRGRR